MRKSIKTLLHLWISMVSVAAFGFGWFFLAHAEKPAPLIAPKVEVISINQTFLEPIPTINDLLVSESPSALTLKNPDFSFPRLHTRGS